MRAVKICHSWDSCTFWEPGCLTGIPSHIVTYVNQERIITTFTGQFNLFADALRKDLDQRQMGGNLSIEIIKEHFTKPLTDRMTAIETLFTANSENAEVSTVRQLQGGGPSHTSVESFFMWKHDSHCVPRRLPEDFRLDPAITPILMWHQWHLGLVLKDNRVIQPLKLLPAKDYPHTRRTYDRMKKFCKAIDTNTGVIGGESVAALTALFNQKKPSLVEKGILLPTNTPVGRRRTREGELGWNYVATKWEKLQCAKIKAANEDVNVGEVVEREDNLETERQRDNRRTRKRLSQGTAYTVNMPHDNSGQQQRGVSSVQDLFHPQSRDASSRLLS